MRSMYLVTYKVPKMTGDTVHTAGPYPSMTEAALQLFDIEGFEGVEMGTISMVQDTNSVTQQV